MEVPLYNGEFQVVVPVLIGTTPLPMDQPEINYEQLTSSTLGSAGLFMLNTSFA